MRSLQWILVPAILAVLMAASGCGSDKGTVSPGLTPPTEDTAPPLAPGGFETSKVDIHGFTLLWEPNVEADIAGYRIYDYEPNPDRDQAYVLRNPDALVTATRYVYYTLQGGGDVWVRLAAVDASGNESALSAPFKVSLSGGIQGDVSQQGDGSDAPQRDPWRPRENPVPPTDQSGGDR